MIRTIIFAVLLKLFSIYSDLKCFWENFVNYFDEICETKNVDGRKVRKYACKCVKFFVIFITINITDSNAALWIYGIWERIK